MLLWLIFSLIQIVFHDQRDQRCLLLILINCLPFCFLELLYTRHYMVDIYAYERRIKRDQNKYEK
jgi:hypothetical protein